MSFFFRKNEVDPEAPRSSHRATIKRDDSIVVLESPNRSTRRRLLSIFGLLAVGSASAQTVTTGAGVLPVSLLFYNTAAAVTAANIASTGANAPAYIKTAGYFTAGDYGAATYFRVSSGGQLTSADGQSWQIADLEPYANAFGACGDNSHDDTAAIQAALDFVMNTARYKVRLASTTGGGTGYKISDTLHVGYGWGGGAGRYFRVCLEGETGFSPGAFGSYNPATLYPTFQDRPVINIQGVQQGGVRNLQINGPGTMAGVTAYGNYTGWNVLEFFNQANYVPAVSGTPANSYQNTPFCGVCIDGYYGTAPANPYPSPTVPSWYGTPPAAFPYGVNQSSDYFVEGCTINNTLIGIMNQPNSVGNGDFAKFNDNQINGQVCGICVAGSQARVTNYDRTYFAGCYTCIDGGTTTLSPATNGTGFGSGAGNISGSMNAMHANYCYQLLAFNGGWQKGLQVSNFYSEVMVRIGQCVGTATSISFLDCNFTCDNYNGTTTVLTLPVFDGTDSARTLYAKFVNCKFPSLWGMLYVNANADFEGCALILASGPSATVEIAAYRAMANLFVNGFMTDPTRNYTRNLNINGALYGGYDQQSYIGSQYWHSIGALGFTPINYAFSQKAAAAATELGLTNVLWTNRTFTANVAQTYYSAGDVLFIAQLSGWCVVTAATTTTISAAMITNYQFTLGTTYNMLTSDGNGNWTVQTDTYMNANFTALNGYYFPYNIFDAAVNLNNQFWQTTAGSPTLSYVNAAGTPIAVPIGIVANQSKILWQVAGLTVAPGMPFPGNTKVSAVNANSLTMSANALTSGWWAPTPGICRLDTL